MIGQYVWICLSITATTILYGESTNILAIVTVNGPSQFSMFEKVLTVLAERGHNVDVVSHFPLKKPIPGYTHIALSKPHVLLKNNVRMSVVEGLGRRALLRLMMDLGGVRACEAAFREPALQSLRNTTKRYDLLVQHLLGTDCTLGFAHALRIPAVVSLTTSVDLPWGGHRVGNPAHPAYVPSYFSAVAAPLTFWQRVVNVADLVSSWIAYDYMSIQPTNKICRNFFGSDIPSISELIKKINLILVNSHFSMNQARPTVPNFVEVGGLHIGHPKSLPKKLEDIIERNKHGFIYLTMGSMLMSESLASEKLQGMFDAFSELPQTILWKANRTHFPKNLKIPKNVHFEAWMPQLDILCHPQIKLFITHGGLLGGQEAVYCGVPRIGIPLLADQVLNIAQAVQTLTTLKVSYDDITKDSILEAARELLYNDTYSKNAKRLSELFKDRHNPPLETAVYWIEYVIRHKGAPHLRTIGADLPWYQYYMLDVALVFLFTIFTSTYVICVLIRKAVSKAVSNKRFNKQKSN